MSRKLSRDDADRILTGMQPSGSDATDGGTLGRFVAAMEPLAGALEISDDDPRVVAIARAIAEAPNDRIVVTHGTDTMTDTARVLRSIRGKTIVLTGALSPARFANTDAAFNVGMAFAAVQALPAGVYITMNGQVFDAAKVRKDHATNRFVPV